ncbi:hypothetical protein ABIE50_001387 [Chitinophaga sp. OAE865]
MKSILSDLISNHKEPFWILVGTAIFPIAQFLYPDLKKYFSDRIRAKKVFFENIDAILITSDELLSKLFDMIKTDFKGTYSVRLDQEMDNNERIYTLYLFASFWGNIAVMRHESSFSKIAKVRIGKRFLKFLIAFESKGNNRIIDRSTQRIIGDAMLKYTSQGLSILSLYEFSNELSKADSGLRKIMLKLDEVLANSGNRKNRQKIILFGILLKYFIDYFDPKHILTRNRYSTFINKLSTKSRNELDFKILKLYLKFIKFRKKNSYWNTKVLHIKNMFNS